MKSPKDDKEDQFDEAEATKRFEAALRGGLKTPHEPLKEKPKVKKATPDRKPQKAPRSE
jgi:hypothetical protein